MKDTSWQAWVVSVFLQPQYKSARVSKIGVEAEHILSLKETAKPQDLSALRSIYLEKVYLERPVPTQPATVQTNTRWIWNEKGTGQETLYFSKQFELKELPQSAEIFFTCDDNVEFYLNGHSIGSTDLWSKPVTSPIKKHFRKGVNFLTAKAPTGVALPD